MAFDRQVEIGHATERRGIASSSQCQLVAADEAARRFDPGDLTVFPPDAGHFALLDQIDAARIGAARIAPGNRVMAGRSATLLQQTAEDGEPGLVVVQVWHHLADLLAVEQVGIDTDASASHCRAAHRRRAGRRNETG